MKLIQSLAVMSAMLPFSSSGQTAAIVYDNSLNDLNASYGTNNVEFGDEITLGGTERILTDFRFEYFISANANLNESVQVRFYANDGPEIIRTNPDNTTFTVNSPGTLLFTSSPLTIGLTGYGTVELSQLNFAVPDTFTWAVTFSGVDANEVAALRLFDPPTVGSSFNDFWQRSEGTWNTYVIPDNAANFAARVTAVPEPTTMALALLAGFGWIGYLGFKRRS